MAFVAIPLCVRRSDGSIGMAVEVEEAGVKALDAYELRCEFTLDPDGALHTLDTFEYNRKEQRCRWPCEWHSEGAAVGMGCCRCAIRTRRCRSQKWRMAGLRPLVLPGSLRCVRR